MTNHLVGLTEIARMLGLSRQRVHQLASNPDFPKPAAVLIGSIIWNREDIEAWARRTSRLPADD